MKKSKWLDCQGNEFFPKQKGTPSLVKIEHKNTATLDSARSEKKSKVAVLQLASGQTLCMIWKKIVRIPHPRTNPGHFQIPDCHQKETERWVISCNIKISPSSHVYPAELASFRVIFH